MGQPNTYKEFLQRKRRTLIVRVILSFWLAWLFAVWLAMNYFGFHRPRNPIPAEGRVYPFNDHGTLVYLSRAEHLLVDLWFCYVLIGILIMVIAKERGWDPQSF
jgi:hypothetical protein